MDFIFATYYRYIWNLTLSFLIFGVSGTTLIIVPVDDAAVRMG